MIAIQNKGSFAEYWINYCKEKNISYKIVDCYANDIISQLSDCESFLWHFHHASAKDVLFAKQLLYSLEISGIKTFPNFLTMWSFDDKIGQKYQLEAINAPLVPSFVFYSKSSAINWAKNTTYPKVFKLRGGAGSSNVFLVKNKNSAYYFINKSFKKGFKQYRAIENLKERWRKYLQKKTSLKDVLKGLIRCFYPTEFSIMYHREKGYVYFQEFIPNNKSDIRIIVIGNKAFGIKRLVRDGDFRASGSGSILYTKDEISERCVSIAFEVNKKLKTQSIAFDFVFDTQNNPLIIEISYGFSPEGYNDCHGFWTNDLVWHEGKFNPYGWMIEDIIYPTLSYE